MRRTTGRAVSGLGRRMAVPAPGGGMPALLGDLLALALIAFVTLLASEVPVADTRPAAGAELVDLRTEHSRTVDNGDGTRTTTTSIEPLHFRAADGRLERVATQLMPHGRDSVINRAAGFRVAFDRRAGEDFVRLEHRDRRLGLTLEGARAAEAEVRGSTVAYRDVARDVSLEYVSRPSSVKETIVIEGPGAPARYRFRLSQPAGSDLRARRLRGGAWLLSDRAAPGSRFVVEAPWAVDARGAGLEDSGARLDVSRDGDDLLLDVAVDARWLRAGRRAFPVRLDPTISVAPAAWLTYDNRCSTCPGTVYYESKIGTAPSDQFWRTAVRFDLAGIPAEGRITDADVEMFWEGNCLVAATGPCGSHTFNAHRITAGWDSSSRPGEIATDNGVVSSYSLPSGAAPRWLTWDVTALARDWHDGTSPNFGVALKTPNEAATVDGIRALVFQSRMAVTYAVDQVTLYGAEDVGPAGATLIWSRFAGESFAGYEVHRSATAGFTPSSATRLTTLTSLDATRFEDTTAAPGTSFSYKIVTGGKASNEQRVALPAANQASRTVLRLDPAGGEATGIWQLGPGHCTNEGAEPTLAAGPGRRGLLRFDLRDVAPASKIASARLSLWRTDRSDTAGGQLELAPVAREWREGSTADCTSDGATWDEAQSGVPWTTAGGDVTAGAVGSTLPVDTPPGWQEWDVTAIAREWVAGQRPNHGLRLARPAGPAIRFNSDDDTISPSLRPKLEIVYQDPDPVGVPTAAIVAPRPGERVRGTIAIEAAAGDDRRVERVEFLVDGTKVSEDASAPYAADFDTRAKTNGSHTLRVRAVDDAGNATLSDAVDVEVANFDPPTVRLTSPAADYAGTVKGDAPAGFWRLGETSGASALDASGNNRHGGFGGYYALGQAGLLTGDADRSIKLNAGYGRVTATGFDYRLSPRISVEAWVQHPGFSATADTEIVSNNFAAVGGWALGVRRLSTGAQQAYFAVRTSTGVVYAPQPIAPSATNPPTYHLVGTFDGSSAGLYLDAQRDGTWSATATATGNGTVVIGNRTAADLRVDDVAVYTSVLTREQVRTHFELGRGRPFWVEGLNDLRADATPGSGRTLRGVEFVVDGQVAAEDLAAPYTVPWDTLAAGAQVPDGPHTVVARATDDHGRVTDSAPVTVSVQNTAGAPQRAELTAAGPLPGSLVHDPAAATQATTPVDVRVKNTGSATLGSDAVLRARWIGPDGSFDDSAGANVALGTALPPGGERTVTAQVAPPALPPGADRSRMTLRLDLRDTAAPQTWWAARGNPPLDHSAMIQRATPVGLGLERYYHYDGESLGAGMSHLVNLASGNSIVRFTPFASPGRGLSTVVDLTYNSKAGGTAEPGPGGPKPQELRASPLGPAWSIAISSLSPLGEPLRCASPPNSALHAHKCEDIATKTTPDLSSIVMELTDADGTVHRFNGRRTAGHTTWQEPQGVHLYLRELEADERPTCNIADGNPAKLMWAFTRPDGVTFYYENNGWPTGASDRDGNCIDLKVEDPGNDKRLRVTEVVDAAGVANPALRARRTYRLAYHPGQPGPGGGSPNYPQLASITDHTGSKLSFEYFNDDYLRRMTQQGGTTPEGLGAPSRTWSFRWTDQKFDGQYTVPNASENKTNPKNSFRLYSVTDPKGRASTFTYIADGHANKKDAGKLAWRIDREQAQTSFAYDETARTTTVDLPEGRHSRYTFDAEGSVTRIVDRVAAGREETSQVAWTDDRHVRTVTEPTGAFTEFAYDANGYLTKRWDQLRRLTQLEYEPVAIDDDDVAANWRAGRTVPHISQLAKRITPRNKQWLFDHEDATGRLLGVTDPEGFVTRHAYNADGTLRETRDGLRADGAGGYVTAAGEPVRTTSYPSYDANGLPAEQVDPAGGRTRFCHDDDGLLRWTQDPRHAGSPAPPDPSRCFEHDGRAYRSYFDYDPLHRMVRQSAPKSTQHEPGNLIWSHARFDANDNVTDQFGPVYGPTLPRRRRYADAVHARRDGPRAVGDAVRLRHGARRRGPA